MQAYGAVLGAFDRVREQAGLHQGAQRSGELIEGRATVDSSADEPPRDEAGLTFVEFDLVHASK